MRPFNITVFRIRLLLLAFALGLMGFGGDKGGGQLAHGQKPIKVARVTRCNSPNQLFAVHRLDCGGKKHIGARS
jgi:hypothetical protein